MDVLVTGGAGFIGSHFVKRLVAQGGIKVSVIDSLTYAGNVANLLDVAGKIDFKLYDIRERSQMKEVFSNTYDVVVHFAAETHVTRSELDKKLFWDTNVRGTQILLESCVGKVGKFIHISTDEVYGPVLWPKLCVEEDKAWGIQQATSHYAQSKSAADDLAQMFMGDIPINIVRPTNNFGPFQHPEKMIPRLITHGLRDKPMIVWGEGKQVRDWLYVGDTCSAIEKVMDAPPNEIYNVGSNNEPEIWNRDLAYWIKGRLYEFLWDPAIEFIDDPRPNHDFRYGVNTEKIQALGWQPHNVWDMLNGTIIWYHNNRDWWQPQVEGAEAIYEGNYPRRRDGE